MDLCLARLILQAEDRSFPLRSSDSRHGQVHGGHQVTPRTWAVLLAVCALLNKKMKEVNINIIEKEKKK